MKHEGKERRGAKKESNVFIKEMCFEQPQKKEAEK